MQMNNNLRRISIAGLAVTLLGLTPVASSQAPATFDVPPANAPLTAADFRTLVGPIALFADDLVSIVLPASTYPLQIVQASRFYDALEADSTLQPDPNWDSSVVALLNYPEILRMLDANIEWTWALGEAVLDEQPVVMDAIQQFRREAMRAGNLVSDAQQTVTESITENGNLIEIAPANPEVIYIPYYEPEQVVVLQPRPVFHYYSNPYPLYYYPYPIGYRFGSGFFWGVTTAFHIGWHSHSLHVYHHRNRLHPYYGRSYYSPYYARRGVNININVNRVNHVWQPRQRHAARPLRASSRTRVTATREGTVNSRRATTETVTRTNRLNSSNGLDSSRTATRPRTTTRNAAPTRSNQSRVNTQRSASRGVSRASNGASSGAVAAPSAPVQTFGRPQRQSATTQQQRSRVTTRAPQVRQQAQPTTNRARTNQAKTAQPRTSQRTLGGVSRSAPRAAPSRAAPTRSSGAAASSGSTRASGAASRSSNRGSRQNGRTQR